MKRKFLIVACVFAAISMFSCKAQNVDVADAASYIRSLTKDSKVVVTGKFPNNSSISYGLLYDMNIAIVDCGYKVELDLSNTTGLINMSRAFEGCTGLASITIPDSVTYIDSRTFIYCSGLEKISVSAGNKVYDSRNNCNAIIETSSNSLILGCKNTVIPDSVNGIEDSAFANCTGLTSITIPDNVTEIGGNAFYGCSGLESVTIPNSVTEMGIGAFARCSELISVTISEGVTEIGRSAFAGCTNLKSIKIPDSVSIIGGNAFAQCFNLKNIKFSEELTQIGPSAFQCCTSLEGVTIPDSVTEIGERAFACCTNIKNLIIPANVEKIGYNTFFYCKNLQSVTIPDDIWIDSDAFADCLTLREVTVPVSSFYHLISACASGANAEDSSTGKNIKVVVTGEFENDSLEDFRNALISLKNREYNYMLRSTFIDLDLSNTTELDEIGEKAFFSCANLSSIVIPNSVTEIGNEAFYDCRSLESVTIPNSVTTIGDYAFFGCTSLANVTIPNSVTEIGWNAFSDLKSVVFKDSKNWFDGDENAVDLSNSKKAAEYLVQEECPYLYKDITKSASANKSAKSSSKSSGGKNVVIKSSDGKTKVNLVGTWTSSGNNGLKFTLKINSDGTFFYSAYTNSYSGPKQLSHKPDGTMSTSIGYESKGNWRIIDGNILHREYTSSWATDSDILSEVAPRKGEVTDREIRVLGEDQIFFGDAIWTKQ